MEGRLAVECFQWRDRVWVSAVRIHPAPDRKVARRDALAHLELSSDVAVTEKQALYLMAHLLLDVSDRM